MIKKVFGICKQETRNEKINAQIYSICNLNTNIVSAVLRQYLEIAVLCEINTIMF